MASSHVSLLLQDQFPAHAVAPRGPMLPPRELPANIPWDATTSYQDTYKAYELQPRASPAPVVAPKSTAKFDGDAHPPPPLFPCLSSSTSHAAE